MVILFHQGRRLINGKIALLANNDDFADENEKIAEELKCSMELERKMKLEFGRKSFYFLGALVYNSLPLEIRKLNSRVLLRQKVNEHF